MPNTYVKNSTVSGQGLFAKRNIKRGEIIIDNRHLEDTFYLIEWKRLKPSQYNKNWLIPVDELYCLTSDKDCELHYMNHSRTPNCEWHIDELYITAKKLIKKDEEFFIDYREEHKNKRFYYEI